jgi:hypothetical protein
MKAHERMLSYDKLQEKLEALGVAIEGNNVQTMRTMLQEVVEDYTPASDMVDFVYLEKVREA